MMQMTNFQAMTYTIFLPIAMLIIGFIMGRMSKPKIYHGHIEPVSDKAIVKEAPKRIDVANAVNRAFHRRVK